MKKILITACIAVSAVQVFAQSQFGIFAGPQVTTSKYVIEGDKQKNSSKYGFMAGAGWKIPFENKLYFSPAAFYSLKGYKVDLSKPAFPPDKDAINNNTTLHTLELAFLLQYDFTSKPDHFFVKLGPSLDFQLVGKEKFTLNNGSVVNRDMVFSFGDYGHYSANALVHFGYETKKGLVIAAQYTYGLASIDNADGGPGIFHRAYGLTIGKYIAKKK